MERKLTDDETAQINGIIALLQDDLSKAIDHTKKHEFNDALRKIVDGMGHTECPICKEKLAMLSSDIIKAKISCKSDDASCHIIIKDTIKKAEGIKNDFIPIATKKKFIKNKEKEKINPRFEIPNNPPKWFPDPLGLFKKRDHTKNQHL